MARQIATASWDTIYSLIGDNLTDPKDRDKKWIYSSYPDERSKTFPGYPIITITSPDISSKNISMGAKTNEATLMFAINVFSDSMATLDTLVDDIYNILNNNQNLTDLKNLEIVRMSTETFDRGKGTKVHQKTITVKYMMGSSNA